MQIVPSTILALLAIAVLLRQGPRNGFWIFLALTPLGAAAAFNLPAVGGASIMVAQLAVVAVVTLVCLAPGGFDRLAGTIRPGQPGFWVALLLLYSIFSALFAARIFQGATDVFSISRSANTSGIISIPLRPNSGNITQLFVMILSTLSFFAFATLFRLTPDRALVMKAMAAATIVHVGLGWIDVASHAVGADWLLDPIRTANYAILDDHRMIGLKRMVGGFAEASSYGAYSVGIFAFWLVIWLKDGNTRLGRWLLFLSLVSVLRSTSSGAYVSLGVFLLLTGGWHLASGLRAVASRRVVAMSLAGIGVLWLSALLMFAAYHFSDGFQAFIDRSLLTKLSSSSGIERMSWNAQAYRNFLDTGLIGAGLGSVRASNWLLASLGSLGLPGTLLFLAALISLWRAGRQVEDPQMRATLAALKAACLGLFITDLLTAASPVPGLFMATLAGAMTGLSRGTVLQSDAPPEVHKMAVARPALAR